MGPISGVQCYLLSWLKRVIAHLGRVLIRVGVFVLAKRSDKCCYFTGIFFFISNFLEKLM